MSVESQIPPVAGTKPSRGQLASVSVWIATGSYVGLFPFMPGTVGSLWGIPVAWGLHQLPTWWLQLLVLAALWIVAVPICTRAAARLGAKDPGAVVLDEILAMPLAYFAMPLDSPAVIVLGFVLFRVFDILKPPPARQLERLPRGLGIMADDLAAGLYAQLGLRILVLAGLL